MNVSRNHQQLCQSSHAEVLACQWLKIGFHGYVDVGGGFTELGSSDACHVPRCGAEWEIPMWTTLMI